MNIFRQIIATARKNNKKTNKTQGGGACCTNKIIQKCLSSLVSLFLMLGMVPQNVFGLDNHTVDASGNWTINNVQGLVEFREAVNGGNKFENQTVTLAVDLDLSSVSPWVPIGPYSPYKPFKGTFDGGGHKITGLHIDGRKDYQGLFGSVPGGTVENVTLEGVTCEEGSGECVGGICGRCDSSNTTISNCTVSGEIKSRKYVGGICGRCDSSNTTISNCTVTGDITGSDNYVGGICGDNNKGPISNCTVTGDITSSYSYVGGICGRCDSSNTTISNCTVDGSVTTGSGDYVGGICGYMDDSGTISNCTVSGTITGGQKVGGICGFSYGTISNCTVTGDVTGSGEKVGGICGYISSRGTISNCTVAGDITGSGEKVGGICGYSDVKGTISNCVVYGTATGTDNVGGIVGGSYGTTQKCASFADVSGKVAVGGIGGNCNSVTDCYATGNISGESEIGGIVGGRENNSAVNDVTSSYFSGTINGIGHDYEANKLCYIGGINGYDVNGANKKCFCLAPLIKGSDDPDFENIKAFISAVYLQGKPGSSSPIDQYPAITDNDEECFYRADLGEAPGIGYDGEPLAIEPGWQQKFVDLGWDESVWDLPSTDPDSPEYLFAALPTLKGITTDQHPWLRYYKDLQYLCKAEDIGLVPEDISRFDLGNGYYRLLIDPRYYDSRDGITLETLTSTDTTRPFLGWVAKDNQTGEIITEFAPTEEYVSGEIVASFLPLVTETPDSSENPESGTNSHPEWGEREIHGGIIHYVNAEGMTSVEISAENTDANGIVWLREESEGTAAWYGIDNSASTFESGSRFYVQWLNTAEHPESFAEIDEETRQQVEENRGWLFKIGVIAPDGTRYSTLSNPVKVYVQIGDDWDKDDLQGFYVQQGADENVEVSYVEGWPYPEGTDEFGVMQLSHFSPYFIYDKDGAKSQNPATSDELSTFVFLVMSGVLAGAMFITFAKLSSMRRKSEGENYFTNTLI